MTTINKISSVTLQQLHATNQLIAAYDLSGFRSVPPFQRGPATDDSGYWEEEHHAQPKAGPPAAAMPSSVRERWPRAPKTGLTGLQHHRTAGSAPPFKRGSAAAQMGRVPARPAERAAAHPAAARGPPVPRLWIGPSPFEGTPVADVRERSHSHAGKILNCLLKRYRMVCSCKNPVTEELCRECAENH